MSDRSSWYARKLNQENAPKTPPQPPYTPTAQPQYPQPQYAQPQAQPYQQQQPTHTGPMSKEQFEQALRTGNPDQFGGPKTAAVARRNEGAGCPECGSKNVRPRKGNSYAGCFDCGYNERFTHTSGS